MRPGLGYTGVDHLRDFVSKGGLLITCEDTAQFAIDLGLAPGVFVAPKGNVHVVGSILNGIFVDKSSPVANGYTEDLGLYSADGMAFTIADTVSSSGSRTKTLRKIAPSLHPRPRPSRSRGRQCRSTKTRRATM
jgi:hypothetical protein